MTNDPQPPDRHRDDHPPSDSAPRPDQQSAEPTESVSAGEGGLPSDMRYYRIRPASGALMMLATIGLPIAAVLLVIAVAVLVF